tara:strand:- start:7985 stop:8344 length:360 start_codon:yes stop_codon:yes gene_type:complete
MEHLTLKEDLSEQELLLIQDEIDYKRMDEILEYLYKNRPQFLDIHWIDPSKALKLLDNLGKYNYNPTHIAPRDMVRDYVHILETFFLKGFVCERSINQLHSLFENEIERCSSLKFKKNF